MLKLFVKMEMAMVVLPEYTLLEVLIFIKKGCDIDNMKSCVFLGIISSYENQEYAQSLYCYTKACNGENMIGCNNFDILNQHGFGVAIDYNIAVESYMKVCKGGEWIGLQ